MRRIIDPAELRECGRPVCVALGMFDGVHLGHQHVIRQAVLDAQSLGGLTVALTFNPHPLAIVRPDRAPSLLQTVSQRLRAIEDMGVDVALVLEFDDTFRNQTGEEFTGRLVREFGCLRSFSVGEGFEFGRDRSGSLDLLRRLGGELGFRVHGLAPISVGGEVVSSTRIREVLRQGDLSHVAELLGRPYSLAGIVQRGDQLGRQLGVPTANLDVRGRALPPNGVYAGRTRIDKVTYPVALNLGMRPTVGGSELRAEAHVINATGDWYGLELEIQVIELLREERRFANLTALKAQISEDLSAVRARG
ncbi:MAG: bifunctional riboflavin kinase/FAD synthetase [Pedosphaera sp.]|nr:bifunctional riboflavin kinase/FAD synthetase [Pedosphaera sp.]